MICVERAFLWPSHVFYLESYLFFQPMSQSLKSGPKWYTQQSTSSTILSISLHSSRDLKTPRELKYILRLSIRPLVDITNDTADARVAVKFGLG
jgi:hypothetical protein